jgi:hypothetical protein
MKGWECVPITRSPFCHFETPSPTSTTSPAPSEQGTTCSIDPADGVTKIREKEEEKKADVSRRLRPVPWLRPEDVQGSSQEGRRERWTYVFLAGVLSLGEDEVSVVERDGVHLHQNFPLLERGCLEVLDKGERIEAVGLAVEAVLGVGSHVEGRRQMVVEMELTDRSLLRLNRMMLSPFSLFIGTLT